MTPLLQLTSVTKSFGAVRALKGVSFDLRAGALGHREAVPYGSRRSERSEDLRSTLQTLRHPSGVPERTEPSHAQIRSRRFWHPSGMHITPTPHSGGLHYVLTSGYRLATLRVASNQIMPLG